MKIAFLIAMFLAASTGETEENNVRVVSLMDGVEMEIRKIQFPRILPTAYYDQALSSIPGLYPDSEIVAKIRYRHFGNNQSSAYSMVCYKESPEFHERTISGVVVSNRKAWRYEARVNKNNLNDTLILVLENIFVIPFNNLLQ